MNFRPINFIKDLLFPVFCVECHVEGSWWCADCRARQPTTPIKIDFDPADSALDRLTALFDYREGGSVARLIQLFKYHYATDMAELWEKIIGEAGGFSSAGVVVPVPLYGRRERERGYNQAVLIARILATKNNWVADDKSLIRIRATSQQARLSKEQRTINVQDAFAWRGATPAPARVILVDDVYTTGSTMRECARVLKENGVKQVEGIVLARGISS